MNIRAIVTIAGLVGVRAWAGEDRPAPERKMTVCMDFDRLEANLARDAASNVFKGIGVSIEWQRYGHSCPGASGAIVISLSYDTPRNRHPDALAYARPYEGTHIVVFYDRVRAQVAPARVPLLLAYVIVHEIAHILQGSTRHSTSGIMKAKWDHSDYFNIARKSLRFDEVDVDLIHRGMDWRQSRITGAGHSSQDHRDVGFRPSLPPDWLEEEGHEDPRDSYAGRGGSENFGGRRWGAGT